MKNTFTTHYNGNRQPFGLYTHPIHVAPDVPGVETPNSTIVMINDFIDWAQLQQNVWIITNYQLLEWVRNPTPISQLNSFAPFQCETPQVNAKICNGIPADEAGLVQECDFPDFPFWTCYGCPVTPPTPDDPNPQQATPSDGSALRYRISANCSTPWWDPVAGNCLCQASSCQFTDETRPIGPNGVNLTGGGTGQATITSEPTYIPFNGAAIANVVFNPAILVSGLAVIAGAVVGARLVL